MSKPKWTHNERYELLAELFFTRYGLMAPGKDEPSVLSPVTQFHERLELFKSWNPVSDLIEALLSARAECADLADTIRRMEHEK